MFTRILLATDLTEKSSAAMELALGLAQTHRASLIALCVVGLPRRLQQWAAPVMRADLELYRELLSRQVESARKVLETRMARARDRLPAGIRCIVRTGVPASEIAKASDEHRVDLIVVARGRRGALGSTAEQIVSLAGKAVLVAPVKLPTRLRPPAVPPPGRPRRRATA